MPLFDQEKMVRLVSELRKSVARLRNISGLPLKDFLKPVFDSNRHIFANPTV
jgi:hypothetical protein